MTAPPPQSEIGGWVRNFVHYGNLVENYTKQAGAARKLRDDYEAKVINSLRVNNMQNAVIQISGARLQYGEEKTVPALSMPRLEAYLHAYFKQKGNGFDETDAILRYLKLQKINDTQIVARLKKTNINVPGPANLDKKDASLK